MIAIRVCHLQEASRRATFWAGLLDRVRMNRVSGRRADAAEPVNHSAIRVAGHELSGITRTIGVLGEQVESISQLLSAQMTIADPSTPEGQAIERLALEVGRISMRLQCSHTMQELADEMINSGGIR